MYVGYVTDNADHEADEAGGGGVGSIGFRHSATMHKMGMVFLVSADSLQGKSISGNCDPDLSGKFRYSKNGYREIHYEKIFTQEKF